MNETNGSNTLPELTLEQVTNSIRTYLAQGNAGQYSIGKLYNYTVANQLAEKKGFGTSQDYFSQTFKELSQATLSRYGAVARAFTEEACRRHGVMRLTTLSTYARAAELELKPTELDDMPIDVPQEGGPVSQKPFAECSLDELKKAVKYKRRPLKPSMPQPDVARVDFVRESFSRHFAQGARVQLKTSVQGGKTLVTIQGVPLDDLERLAEALLDSLPPKLVRTAG
jgi:translation initiation factor 1 (eIF-1/SUI1)